MKAVMNKDELRKRTVEKLEEAAAVFAEREKDVWTPVEERLPVEERKEYYSSGRIGYLYPCLVTRLSDPELSISGRRIYVAKHYFDGEDFVNQGEEICTEYILAWRPLPKPYIPDDLRQQVEDGELDIW